ncbi:hypothetical protein KC339_g36 [Hortaea werneckii]|nr:hypothetical protein KC339_g36 [Hortaea werneckii]
MVTNNRDIGRCFQCRRCTGVQEQLGHERPRSRPGIPAMVHPRPPALLVYSALRESRSAGENTVLVYVEVDCRSWNGTTYSPRCHCCISRHNTI